MGSLSPGSAGGGERERERWEVEDGEEPHTPPSLCPPLLDESVSSYCMFSKPLHWGMPK